MPEDTVDTLAAPADAETLGETLLSQPGGVADQAVAPGTIIGRYVILSELGAGGMGVVFAAYDPELDRKVALKLLRASGGSSDAGRARLQREAQALAKLDHRNVVSVHDVGVHGGQLFVGMEFVEGQTLAEWMASPGAPRPWPEVVKVFTAAGKGLAAAHEAGLVHRDFKPDNVMLGCDGRVRVMDFGLARSKGEDEGAGPGEAELGSMLDQLQRGTGNLLLRPLTRTGMMMGTPAYMSPEQFHNRDIDARSDQFSFCVALYEALYGERPFPGERLMDVLSAVVDGQLREPPKTTTVPAWLRKVVVRGLATSRDERWPSMTALLSALADDPRLRRRKWWAGAAVVGLLGAAVAGLWYAVDQDAQSCTGMSARLDGVWDPSRRAEVQAAIEGTQLSYAPGTWVRVEQALDAYTQRWLAARVEACEATHHGEQSGELLDLRMACLDERLRHVQATVELLAVADELVVNKAVEAVSDLPSLDRCADVDALREEIPPPEDPAVARRVTALTQELTDAVALERLAKYAQGLAVVDAVVDEAETLGYEPLLARAWLRQGSLRQQSGDYEGAAASLEQAFEAAVGLRMNVEAARASAQLVSVVGRDLARHEDGRRWARSAKPLARAAGTDEAQAMYFNVVGLLAHAEGNYEQARADHERALAIWERWRGPNHRDVGIALTNLGLAANRMGEYEQAHAYHERALDIVEQVLGPEHPWVAASLSNLGIVAHMEGKSDQARDYHARALAIFERALGPDHLHVAASLTNLGAVVEGLGQLDEARRYHERALAIREAALGPEHPQLAMSLINLGTVAKGAGDDPRARAYYERALTLTEQALGPDHPEVANVLDNLGIVAKREGDYEQARRYHERALAILEVALGPDHPEVAYPLDNLGAVAHEQGNHEQARRYHERALAIWEAGLGPEHPNVAYSLTSLGRARVDEGHPADALAYLERALSIRTSSEVHPTSLAETRFALALALWDAPIPEGRDRPRALALAQLARSAFAQDGEGSASSLAQVETWLGQHADR